MARRYAADMEEAAVPILAVAAAQHTPVPSIAAELPDSAEQGCRSGMPRERERERPPDDGSPCMPESGMPREQLSPEHPPAAAVREDDAAHARSLLAAASLSATEPVLDALDLNPGCEDLGDGLIKIVLRGDGSYDLHAIFKFCHDLAIDTCHRIRRNANLRSRGVGKARPLAVIDQLGGGNPDPKTFYQLSKGAKHLYQKAWKVIASYGNRWLHEAGFSSFKALPGGSIMAVKPSNMAKEVARKISLYNRLQAAGAEAAANA